MKARTKIQLDVQRLVDLGVIRFGQNHKNWAIDACVEHIAYRTKNKMFCLDCGYSWGRDTDKNICVCPSCGQKLKIKTTRKRKKEQKVYFAILEAISSYQVSRYFELCSYHKIGETRKYVIREICQQWFRSDGKYVIRALAHKLNYTQD